MDHRDSTRFLVFAFQMDMMGQSVYEYSHPCDHDELRECLSTKLDENNDKCACSFFLRLKCTLTNKGRKVNLKSASYKVGNVSRKLCNSNRSRTIVEMKKNKNADPVRVNYALVFYPR